MDELKELSDVPEGVWVADSSDEDEDYTEKPRRRKKRKTPARSVIARQQPPQPPTPAAKKRRRVSEFVPVPQDESVEGTIPESLARQAYLQRLTTQ